MEVIDNVIRGAGYGVIVFIFGLAVFLLACGITNIGRKIVGRFKRRQRFNKKCPQAKCYCVDCVYYDRIMFSGTCEKTNKEVPENGFCWQASINHNSK